MQSPKTLDQAPTEKHPSSIMTNFKILLKTGVKNVLDPFPERTLIFRHVQRVFMHQPQQDK